MERLYSDGFLSPKHGKMFSATEVIAKGWVGIRMVSSSYHIDKLVLVKMNLVNFFFKQSLKTRRLISIDQIGKYKT